MRGTVCGFGLCTNSVDDGVHSSLIIRAFSSTAFPSLYWRPPRHTKSQLTQSRRAPSACTKYRKSGSEERGLGRGEVQGWGQWRGPFGFVRRPLHTSSQGRGRSSCNRCLAPAHSAKSLSLALLAHTEPHAAAALRRGRARPHKDARMPVPDVLCRLHAPARTHGVLNASECEEAEAFDVERVHTLWRPVVRMRSSTGPRVTFTTVLKR